MIRKTKGVNIYEVELHICEKMSRGNNKKNLQIIIFNERILRYYHIY